MGLVEISGLAIGPYVCTSPLKQLDCYYYRSVAWELKQRGKNSEWVKVAEETLHVPFYVDDNTDRVLVDPRGADMDLHCDLQEQYNRSGIFGSSEMPGNVAEFLMRHGANPDKHIKAEEFPLCLGDAVTKSRPGRERYAGMGRTSGSTISIGDPGGRRRC
jgi:hypothetical protein